MLKGNTTQKRYFDTVILYRFLEVQYLENLTSEVQNILGLHYITISMWTPTRQISHSKIMALIWSSSPPPFAAITASIHSSGKAFH